MPGRTDSNRPADWLWIAQGRLRFGRGVRLLSPAVLREVTLAEWARFRDIAAMKPVLLLSLAVLLGSSAFGQSARQLTRRIAPLTQPPAPRAQPGAAGAIVGGTAVAVPADPAKVAAEKQKTESNLIKYHRQRAEAGSDNAQYELGMRYLTGAGVPKDEKIGRDWIDKAAKGGNAKAVKKLQELGPAPAQPVETKTAAPAK